MERFRRKQKSLFPFIIGIFLIAGGWIVLKPPKSSNSNAADEMDVFLEIGSTKITLDIADTPEERRAGLSGRDSLPDERGMLFVFDNPGFYNFWMDDVSFALDIIWISQDWEIIDIDKNVLPSSYPKTFTSSKPSLYVLEVSSGFADDNQVAVGQTVKLLDSAQDR